LLRADLASFRVTERIDTATTLRHAVGISQARSATDALFRAMA
jgi:hypothetical protein